MYLQFCFAFIISNTDHFSILRGGSVNCMCIIENKVTRILSKVETLLITMGIDAESPVSPFRDLYKLRTLSVLQLCRVFLAQNTKSN